MKITTFDISFYCRDNKTDRNGFAPVEMSIIINMRQSDHHPSEKGETTRVQKSREHWLTYLLNHLHEYDTDYNKDPADFLPANLVAKGLLKKSECKR